MSGTAGGPPHLGGPPPAFTTAHAAVYVGHVSGVLATMASDSVDCIVSSPPYWGLRDYGIEPVVIGGDAACRHSWETEELHGEMRRGLGLADSPVSIRGGGKKVATTPDITAVRSWCTRCSAWRGDLGLEPTVELYVEHMVLIFRELRRLLRPHGTLWLNMGDTYVTRGGATPWGSSDYETGRGPRPQNAPNRGRRIPRGSGRWAQPGLPDMARPLGLKEKDLVGVPWRLAFALQQDGWYLRSDIVWSKPNPMPESVTDRPTKAHEYLFLLSKSVRYFFDAMAIAEPVTGGTHSRGPAPHEMPKTMKAPTGWDTSVGEGSRATRTTIASPRRPGVP